MLRRAGQLLRAHYQTLELDQRQLVTAHVIGPHSLAFACHACTLRHRMSLCMWVRMSALACACNLYVSSQRAQVKATVMAWVRGAGAGPGQQPPFLRNKIAQVLVCIVQVRLSLVVW